MASACAVSSKCFKPVSSCVNCERKSCELYKKDNVDIQMKVETSRAEAKAKDDSSSKHVKGGKSKLSKKMENIDHNTESTNDDSKEKVGDSKEKVSDRKEKVGDSKEKVGDSKEKVGDSKEKVGDSKEMVSDRKEKVGDSKVYIRCAGCWLMSYCDESCQNEHWNRVHRFHCDFLSGKKVSDGHKEDSCEMCIAQKTASIDQLLDINSPKTRCRFKEDSKQIRRELGKWFRFHEDGQNCDCGNEFACEYPVPIGNIQGNALATGFDEMIVQGAKLCNTFIVKSIKAKEEKDTIARLLVLNKDILGSRVRLWVNIFIYGDSVICTRIYDMLTNLINSKNEVEDKLDNENPWWKSLEFTLECFLKMILSQYWSRQMKDTPITDTKLIEKIEFFKDNVKNVVSISEKNEWNRLKMWPSTVNYSLVLLLPKDVLCTSCNADLSGQIVGCVDCWNPSNPSPSLFPEVSNNGGVSATCSSVQNFDCGKNYATKVNASTRFSEEELLEQNTLLEKSRKCHLCLKWSVFSHRCKGCHAAQYCSVECQREDWHEFHKTVCATWAKDPTRSLVSSRKQKEVNKKILNDCK